MDTLVCIRVFEPDDGGVFFMRVKVTIYCKRCGEKFVLRGRKEPGRIETGFKCCLCDNAEEFIIEEVAL